MDRIAIAIGYIVMALIIAALVKIACEICGNIYGGIKGAYRIHAIHVRSGMNKASHWQRIKAGIKKWSGGNRYDGDTGRYYQVGDMQVPVDGRDKIVRRYRG